MQAAVFLIAIDLRVTDSLRLQRLQPGGSRLAELVEWAELDRLRWAGGRAGGLQIVLQPVVTEGAFLRRPGIAVETDDAIGAGGDAVAAAIADILLDEDGVELR